MRQRPQRPHDDSAPTSDDEASAAGLVLPGGKVDADAVRRAVEQAEEQGADDDAELRTVVFRIKRDLDKRLDKYLTDRIGFLSRNQLQKLIDDGGVLVNLPTQQVREMGADIIIAVDIDERINDLPMSEFEKFGSVAHRVICLHLTNLDQEALKLANIVIHPEVNGIRMVSTKRKDAKAAVAAGIAACEKALPEIRKLVGPENLMVQGKVIGTPSQDDKSKN